MSCLCGSDLDLDKCCARFIDNNEQPQTAEELMRSRYVAYAQIKMDYIAKTHDPKTSKDNDMDANREWAEKTKWLGLEIVRTEGGQSGDEEGIVEFNAKYDSGEGIKTHSEVSTFRKHKGKWFFIDSKSPESRTFVREGAKI